MLVSSVVALLATAASVVSADFPQYNLIKADRDAGRFTFLPTTRAQKEVILKNAENILTAWVNYDSKMTNYGPAADPFPVMKSLRSNIDKISDEELQLSLSDVFVKIRDQHTRWFNSAPYRCFFATTGLEYSLVEGDKDIAKKPTVLVSGITKVPEILALVGKEYSKIELGDELVGINGKTFVEWFKENQFKSGDGANDFGGQRTALEYIGSIYGSVNRLPSVDSIKLSFKSRKHYNHKYTVDVPYVTGHSNACWALSSNMYKNLTNTTLPDTPAPPKSTSLRASKSGATTQSRMFEVIKDLKHPRARAHQDLEEKKMHQAIIGAESPKVTFTPTGVTKVSWAIYKPQTKNMGVIKLDDFEPTDPITDAESIDPAIRIIRSLLSKELKDTKSVVFEIRSNPGGYITFADMLPQLFKPDFEPFGARYLMNNVTHNIFVEGKDPSDIWAQVWSETPAGSRYTKIGDFDTAEATNTYGQAYVRPMGVFTDGNCFSACELFSANVQNYDAGTIFGEDGNTGGGGANILDVDPALMLMDPFDFKQFPFTNELTWKPTSGKYMNRLSVGIRQSVRNGKYNGQLIEDLGIKTDIVVRARWSDLQPNSTTNTQYDRIADNLVRIGEKTGQNKLHFVSEPLSYESSPDSLVIHAEVSGIEKLTFSSTDGKTLYKNQDVPATAKTIDVDIFAGSSAHADLGNRAVRIIGTTKGKQVLKTNRFVRLLPSSSQRYDITTGPAFEFTSFTKNVGLYNTDQTSTANGWNKGKNGKFIIGNGIRYVENVDSAIDVFFTATAGEKLVVKLDVNLDSEPDFDFLYLDVKGSDGKVTPLLSSKSSDQKTVFPGVSGNNVTVTGSFPFTAPSKEFSIALRFTSDGGVDFSGATINQFRVERA
ncbi:expressed protein [Batrachochytrium dendrobatidis JAM81]|uniref:Expressed protein n=2 Tax=Batrachochytrium dendrobatidis TaxID=109871 RepID=F4PEP9_BATDJ|nr:uncharacterized protein BATDEDRAFT_37569 [Batrachochytrium dendrobatidis JAM81]KAJ8323635.1 hypothetical protein O5D80_007524 [Batrachochytrium dendrobatidis]OAJ42997.1 hypothetical protein BDEG_26382 [Batrachochytrium dendrobatidis JEL423]EGF76336.1 expressed protein [Batrachochytrium dendrobatidis JAM81]KAK5666443.1 hypothetical protein QVD99_007199 [Batrachochytrium dendrobatidis]KAK5666444.1 hypothetical protein QVD99_007199 [Batrachochytrium dendrobatidis]|eukprot:XP_006683086.1 expressed protein [Batrachochytrium dendrobatidis JAM81]